MIKIIFSTPNLFLFLFMTLSNISNLYSASPISEDDKKNFTNAFNDTSNNLKSLNNTTSQMCPSLAPTTATPSGCSNLIESFCNELYSIKNQGNIDLNLPDRLQKLRFGETPNGKSYNFVLFEQAKFDSQKQLPVDLQEKLKKVHYFQKMQEYLQSKSVKKMTLPERERYDRLSSDVGQLWNSAIDEVMLERMEKQHPGYSKMTQFPLKMSLEYNKTQDELHASIYRAIWSNNPLWKQVESDFKTVKTEYLKMLDESTQLTPSLKQEWINRIQTTQLLTPGTDPDNIDHECATTDRNAYNNTTRGYITVCAGYFTSGNMMSTLAHELSHSLGISRSEVLFERESELGKRLYEVHNKICQSKETPSCPKEWAQLKQDLPSLLEGFKLPEIPNPQYLSCLQYHQISQQPALDFISSQSKSITAGEASDLSERDSFLRLTESKIPLDDGSLYPNPGYLNPCYSGFFDLKYWTMSGSRNMQFLFTEEYLCADSTLSDPERMKNAIDSAKLIQQRIEEKTFAFGGPFSKKREMNSAGFAEDSEERFADSMGYHVFARILEKVPSIEQRRNLYYAANAKFCERPSLQEYSPQKAQVEKEYSLEPHSSGKQRRMEVLIAPIRTALACNKDFDGKECSL